MNWDGADVMMIRRWMAEMGWESDDRLTRMGWGGAGVVGYSIWFKRWKWHGVSIDGTGNSIHGHTDELGRIRELVAGTATLAQQLYDRHKQVQDVPNGERMFTLPPIVSRETFKPGDKVFLSTTRAGETVYDPSVHWTVHAVDGDWVSIGPEHGVTLKTSVRHIRLVSRETQETNNAK